MVLDIDLKHVIIKCVGQTPWRFCKGNTVRTLYDNAKKQRKGSIQDQIDIQRKNKRGLK